MVFRRGERSGEQLCGGGPSGKAKGERARLEESRTEGQWSGDHDNSSKVLAQDIHTDEAMSASSKMAPEVDEAMSESSWTALANWKERNWWSIDLEGEVQKVEVSGPWSGTKGGSVEPKGEMGHKSYRTKVIREEEEKLKEDEVEVH